MDGAGNDPLEFRSATDPLSAHCASDDRRGHHPRDLFHVRHTSSEVKDAIKRIPGSVLYGCRTGLLSSIQPAVSLSPRRSLP
jgi:hypothetical protein